MVRNIVVIFLTNIMRIVGFYVRHSAIVFLLINNGFWCELLTLFILCLSHLGGSLGFCKCQTKTRWAVKCIPLCIGHKQQPKIEIIISYQDGCVLLGNGKKKNHLRFIIMPVMMILMNLWSIITTLWHGQPYKNQLQ